MLTFRDNALWLKDGAQNIGHAMATDMVMESTWGRAINDKVCYIYDYWHDDSPELNSGIEYTPYTEKTKIDARFIVVQQGSLSKDQVEYHIMFKPSVELNLQNDWPVSYYTESFGRFAEFPVGMYIDIPDNRGVYKRWMVCAAYHELRYTKYSVLPCDYRFQWVKDDRLFQMWGVSRLRNSYNSGIWSENITASPENQDQMWLPMNKYSQAIYYDDRFIISDDLPEPVAWKVSKPETGHPFGIFKITLAQDKFNKKTDKFVDGYWYADYQKQQIAKEPMVEDRTRIVKLTPSSGQFNIRAGTYTKGIAATIFENGVDLTDKAHTYEWDYRINGEVVTGELNPVYDNNTVTLSLKNYDYIGDTLTVSVIVDGSDKCSIELEVIA